MNSQSLRTESGRDAPTLETPVFSVVVPMYNEEENVRHTLSQLLDHGH